MRESGVLVPVPAAERLVGPWRARYDESATKGVPAHVTLLYPFVPPERIDEPILESLRRVFTAAPPFAFSLDRISRFSGNPRAGADDDVLFLAPDPSEPFLRLIGALAKVFPDHPPYEGVYDPVVPHLTVAQTPDAAVLDEIETALAEGLPVHAEAGEAALMEEGEDGVWRFRERFSLSGLD